MNRLDLPYESEGLFITNVLSHIFMCLPIIQLLKRRWTFEACIHCFGILSSFMYHFVQAYQFTNGPPFQIEEIQWHFLDNVAVLACFGVWFTYLAALRDPFTDMWIKVSTVMISIIVQVPHPWDVSYTFGPLLLFFMIPVSSCLHKLFIQKQTFSSIYDVREVMIGFGFLFASLFFFVLGLDDGNDPYRVYHGMWHLFGAFPSLRLWRSVKDPIANSWVVISERLEVKNSQNANNNAESVV